MKTAVKKLLFVLGTRPEAIKLAPVIIEALKFPYDFSVRVAVTAQHRQMLDEVLDIFDITPDYDLNIMKPDQSLFYITASIFQQMEHIITHEQPDVIIVQGDTATTFVAAMSGYYSKTPVAHVEAGLRSGNKFFPFPEEIYRTITSAVAAIHFAPTRQARENLLREGHSPESIHVTGNTVIDALLYALKKIDTTRPPTPELGFVDRYERLVLITGHRRENFGEPLRHVCDALRALALENPAVCFVYPVHLNPNVQKPVREILGGLPNVYLLKPLGYLEFVWLMNRSYFIITDSGGIQEEAPSLGKPVLITRDVTERQEGIEAGALRLVGTDRERIIAESRLLLSDLQEYAAMSAAGNPYGDGTAGEKIIAILFRK